MDIGPFTPIKGGQAIADFMKYNRNHMTRDIIPDMEEAGLMWRHGNKSNSQLITTPLLINIFYVLREYKKREAHTGDA